MLTAIRKARLGFGRAQFFLMLSTVALAFSSTLNATIITTGVTIDQVDFRGASNSTIGEVTIDIGSANAAAGLSSGFVNVADSTGAWLVRNLPIFDGGIYDHPSITTNLDFGTSDGFDVTAVNLVVDYASAPVTSFAGGPAATYSVGDTGYAVGGVGATTAVGFVPAPTVVDLNFFGTKLLEVVYQKGHKNVQAAQNQCAPMSVANSLQYLEDTTSLLVADEHKVGLKGDDSLVGKLDAAMNRAVTSRAVGSPVSIGDILNGKLKYVGDSNLGANVSTKHQGVLGGGDVTANGVTSKGKGAAINVDFIISELKEGEDVEFVYLWAGGGHAVDITGAGYILGVPFITYVSDHLQSDVDGTDTKGTDKVDFSFIVDGKLVNEKATPTGAFLMSQSTIPEPGALAILVIGLLGLTAIRRRP